MIGDSSITNPESQIANHKRVWLSPISSRGGARTTTLTTPAPAHSIRRSSQHARSRGFWPGSAPARSPCCSISARPSAQTSRSSARRSAARFSSRISPRISTGTCTRAKIEDLPGLLRYALSAGDRNRRRHSLLGHLRLPGAALRRTPRAPAHARASSRRRLAGVLQHRRSAVRDPTRPTRATSSSTAPTCSAAPYKAARGKQRPSAESRHPAAVRAAAHQRKFPAQDQPARGAVPQARGCRCADRGAAGGPLSAAA